MPDGKCGYVARPEPESIADAILLYLSERSVTNFVSFIKEEKKIYSWDKMTAGIISIYKKLTGNDYQK